jgi:hypothetical protein
MNPLHPLLRAMGVTVVPAVSGNATLCNHAIAANDIVAPETRGCPRTADGDSGHLERDGAAVLGDGNGIMSAHGDSTSHADRAGVVGKTTMFRAGPRRPGTELLGNPAARWRRRRRSRDRDRSPRRARSTGVWCARCRLLRCRRHGHRPGGGTRERSRLCRPARDPEYRRTMPMVRRPIVDLELYSHRRENERRERGPHGQGGALELRLILGTEPLGVGPARPSRARSASDLAAPAPSRTAEGHALRRLVRLGRSRCGSRPSRLDFAASRRLAGARDGVASRTPQ